MDIIPHIGIDHVRLGSERDAITGQLGSPDRTQRDHHEDGEVSEIWVYRLLRLELSFDSEHDYRLAHITSYHPYSLVSGFNPIGLAPRFLLQKFPHLDLDVDITPEERYYTDRVLDLTYGVSGGQVISVTVFPEYDADGLNVLWPRPPH
ncbi:MAG: hypothetical protein ACPHTD_09050 [Gammaproteobacteria bacterium]|jgi:hypothetical protein